MVHMQSLHNSKAHSESTSLLGTQFLRVRYEYRSTQHASMVLPLMSVFIVLIMLYVTIHSLVNNN